MTIRVHLVDDHEVVRAGFRHLLEREGDIDVVAESATGRDACRDYEQALPDIVILDVSLSDISGLEVLRRILGQHPDARILMLSMHSGMVAEQSLQMGAKGFICKQSGARELTTALRRIMQGEIYGSPGEVDAGKAPLSRREMEICLLLVEGKSVAEVATQLHLSDKTVYTHRQRIMDKLGVSTQVELMRTAERMGMAMDC